MEILESALAFAVAMMIFSTIVTGIVEVLFRVLAMRERVLMRTLESLYRTVVEPRLRTAIQDSDFAKTDIQDFVRKMTANPVYADWREAKPKGSLVHSGRIDGLTTLAFAERLARTDVGKVIQAKLQDALDETVTDFCRSFERFGRASSEVFRKWAQLVSIIVGILLALGLNIDAGRLVTTLVEEPNLRADLVAQSDASATANAKALENLATVQALQEQGVFEADEFEAIKAKTTALFKEMSAAKQIGLPIGWSYFPYCLPAKDAGAAAAKRNAAMPAPADVSKPLLGVNGADGYMNCATLQADTESEASRFSSEGLVDLARWFFMTCLAGVLIGLGGPFWFRVFTSLSQLMQVLRMLGVGGQRQVPASDAGKAASVDATAKPHTVVDAFKIAAKVAAEEAVPMAPPPPTLRDRIGLP